MREKGINQEKKLSRAEEVLRKREKAGGPKWKSLEKYSVRISQEQIDYLHRAAKQIMRTRTGEKAERITSNSILRTAIEILRELGVELKERDIPTERALLSIVRRKLYEVQSSNK